MEYDKDSFQPVFENQTESPDTSLGSLQERNHALAQALTKAGKELARAKAQMSQMSQSPLYFATFVRIDNSYTDVENIQRATGEVIYNSRSILVPISPHVKASQLLSGQQVLLNRELVLVDFRPHKKTGSLVKVDEVFSDGRLLVSYDNGTQKVIQRTSALRTEHIAISDRLLVTACGNYACEIVSSSDTISQVLEEIPDVDFEDIGGLDQQIEHIKDAVQLPYKHRELFEKFQLQPPRGILLYGPPGNGKTMIAKAVARSLSGNGVFLSIKGPEILTKYVGESERYIRLLFESARIKAQEGHPVVVFIDEMDSLLRTRGTGVSSDIETTIVPQFLAELDGVEAMRNVTVIGASNRVDMIDPAILRPGRFDVKIHIERPHKQAAKVIVDRYLSVIATELNDISSTISDYVIEKAYERTDNTLIAHIANTQHVWTPLYFSDIISGALLKNIVDRIKLLTIKATIERWENSDSSANAVITHECVDTAIMRECEEVRQEVADAEPVQWGRINGFSAGKVVFIRPYNS